MAVTADGWNSVVQDHYLAVSVHYVKEGSMKKKILPTRTVYTSQTRNVIVDEIGDNLDEFSVKNKVVVITVDNAVSHIVLKVSLKVALIIFLSLSW